VIVSVVVLVSSIVAPSSSLSRSALEPAVRPPFERWTPVRRQIALLVAPTAVMVTVVELPPKETDPRCTLKFATSAPSALVG